MPLGGRTFQRCVPLILPISMFARNLFIPLAAIPTLSFTDAQTTTLLPHIFPLAAFNFTRAAIQYDSTFPRKWVVAE